MTVAEPDAVRRDEEARLRARTAFGVPLVVDAGAGSGKTSILVGRIVVWCLGPGWERAAARLGADAEPDALARETLSRVVAITFTDAAAAQMAQRVGEWLSRIETGEVPLELGEAGLPEAAVREARARPLRAALDRLVVRTIHAWCRRLLAEHPLEAGLHPAFRVDADEKRTAGVVREVLEHAIPAAYEDPDSDLSRLAARLGIGPVQMEEALLALVLGGAPGDLLDADPLAPGALAGLHRRLGEAARALAGLAALARLEGCSGPRTRATARAVRQLAERLAGDPPGSRPELDGLLRDLHRIWEETASRKRLAAWTRGPEGKGEEEAVADERKAFVEAAGVLHRCLDHVLTLDLVRLELARGALAPLLREVERELRRRGVETFAALLRDTQRLVAGAPEVAEQVRRGVDQLLVDEFQDTDAVQCEIVARIALAGDPAARPDLFIVGDPRQSIYGWRSADLRAYDAFKARVRAEGGEVLHLTRNFRSLPAVLAEVRASVAPLMVAEPGVQPPFQDLVAHRAAAESGGPGTVEHWIPCAWDAGSGAPAVTRSAEANRLEAEALARDVARLGREEGVAWRDVALLFRGMTQIDGYLDALREAGVPYTVERDRRYYQRREVLDASALLRAVLDPHDHVALVGWLRSPSVGVPDATWIPLWGEGFPGLMSGLSGPDPERLAALARSIRSAAEAVDPRLPGLDRVAGWEHSLEAAVATLARLRSACEAEASDRFVERLRTATGIEATEGSRFLGPYRAANLDQFFRDVRDDLEETGGDVPEVLRRVRRAVDDQAEAEEARPREAADDAVRVMSVHKAKGLDFRHVYFVQLHRRHGGSRGGTGTRLGRGDEAAEYALFGAASLGFDRAAEQARRIEAAEAVRTLYVALTRAEDRLVVSGLHPARAPVRSGSHADLLFARRDAADPAGRMAACAAAGEAGWQDEAGVRWRFPALERAAPPASRAAPAASLPAPDAVQAVARGLARRRRAAAARARRPFSQAASALSHEAARERAWSQRFEEDGSAEAPTAAAGPGEDVPPALAAAVGTAVHAVLEHAAPQPGADALDAEGRAVLDAAVAGQVGPSDREPVRDGALRVLEAFAATPLWRELAALGPAVLGREVPVLLAPDPGSEEGAVGFVSGAVDLLYRDPESGEIVVADYKTDDVRAPGAVAERVRSYTGQGAAYVRAVQEALGLAAPPRFELWFLTAGERRVVPPPRPPAG